MQGSVVIPRMFDAHLHSRQGNMLQYVVPLVAQFCQAGVIMPNTDPPIINAQDVREYQYEIREAHGIACNFRALMTVKLTDRTTPQDVGRWGAETLAAKYYPAGATYGSKDGVTDHKRLSAVFAEMARLGIVLSLHGEAPGSPPAWAEHDFLPIFREIVDSHPDLKVVLEHISTSAAVNAVREYEAKNVAATITPHHLWITNGDIFTASEIANPHNWCRPCAKTLRDQKALIGAATSGDPRFFFGSDFAPHPPAAKRESPPAPGCANYPAGLAVVATIFNRFETLGRLGDFTSGHAARFYDITLSGATIELVHQEWTVPETMPPDSAEPLFIPWLAGATLYWQAITA